MEKAFNETKKFGSFSDQLDAFVGHMEWPARSQKEKTNQLEDPSRDAFLKGLQAVLELYYYGIPVETVCVLLTPSSAVFCVF
jgi:hypothetical protein